MALTREWKESIVKQFQRSPLDTGSPEVQVALLSARIAELTEHFKVHKKDLHGMRGLEKLVNRRRKLLDYLKAKNQERYEQLIKSLDIRK
ncbi:MAG: 30S ribosomal protein S15 [Bdellovibrionaceae bacterium]|nr:30S ribosomal protein S15 [Pseudobdellovibrionaceae bacterium]MDW8190437.1 30S ribosomal protein S15 [Pseudobdellovibrionaceae bacterium]